MSRKRLLERFEIMNFAKYEYSKFEKESELGLLMSGT